MSQFIIANVRAPLDPPLIYIGANGNQRLWYMLCCMSESVIVRSLATNVQELSQVFSKIMRTRRNSVLECSLVVRWDRSLICWIH